MTKYLALGGIAQLARAPALQAGGLGFESPYLQTVFLKSLSSEKLFFSGGFQYFPLEAQDFVSILKNK